MIQYDRDGVTLFYIDTNGKRVSHNFMEGAPYNDMVNIRDAQLQAIRENTQTVASYNTTLANIQLNVDAGHAMTAPTKPLMKVVADADGAITYESFNPPLADLKPSMAGTPSPTAPNLGTQAPSRDQKIDILYNMVQLMFRNMFPDA